MNGPHAVCRGATYRRFCSAISRTEAPGKRDYAIGLLLATYGPGAAEVLGIRLEDVDWQGGVLRVCRPKTKVSINLPLLPAVAQALSAYLRWERPPARSVPHIFLRENMPYEPITSGAIRHRIRYYARLAGISTKVIGAHAFRHYAASRTMPHESKRSGRRRAEQGVGCTRAVQDAA
jgi:integrase/recombinase XerD